MDFRTVRLDALKWAKTPRGWSVTSGGNKVRVQVPTCPCRVYPMNSTYSRGWTLELQLGDDDQACAEFAEFVDALAAQAREQAAPPNLEMAAGTLRRQDYARSYTSFRVTAFSDAQVFDEQGEYVDTDKLAHARSLTLLLELQGLWTSDLRWGLRWKVAQAKVSAAPPPPPPPPPPQCALAESDDDM